MRLLGIDFEATSVDPKVARIIEFGVVLWDTDLSLPLVSACGFVAPAQKPLTNFLSDEVQNITGITDGFLNEFGQTFGSAHSQINAIAESAEYIVAHNGNRYDRPLFTAECSREGVEMPDKPWIDTFEDIEYPESFTTRKLSYLATEHGFLNPFPHRALFDVMTMLKVLSLYDINQVVQNANTASVEVRAKVTYEEREQASKRGYRWDKDRKWWVKNIKETKILNETKQCPFQVEVIAK